MKSIVILFSSRGSNMQEIIKKLKDRVDIKASITDNPDAKGLEIAKEFGVKSYILKDTQKDLIELLTKLKPDLVVCAGFMKILSKEFLTKFKAINIHPSLLPRHRGLRAIERSFEDEFESAGVTIHWVDSGVDTGEIISQISLKKIENESFEEFSERIHSLEHQNYYLAIERVLKL